MSLKGKKIVIFIWQDWFHPKSGGAEYYCRSLSQILVRNGALVTIVCATSSEPIPELDKKLTIKRIAPRPFIVPATVAWYTRHHKSFDLVIDFTNKIPYLTPFYVRRPLIAAFMHTNGETFKDEWGLFGFIGITIENLLLATYRKTACIAISQSTKQELMDRGFLSVDVGLVPTAWHKPKPAHPDKGARIAVVSRLRKYKRLDLLIEAVTIVKKTIPHIQVDIIGRGPDQTRLKRLIKHYDLEKNIHFYGYLSNSERDQLMAKAWLTTITSRKEGWGITISEAAQFGLPAIGVDAPGTRDAIIDRQTGRLLADDSPAVLADTIIDIIKDSPLRHRLGKAALAFAQTQTTDKLEETWLKTITKVLQK
jgi:glycosyltransferase involved in cell wall biosynthesis